MVGGPRPHGVIQQLVTPSSFPAPPQGLRSDLSMQNYAETVSPEKCLGFGGDDADNFLLLKMTSISTM